MKTVLLCKIKGNNKLIMRGLFRFISEYTMVNCKSIMK